MNFKISKMVRLTTPAVLTQMNAAARIYDFLFYVWNYLTTALK